MSNEGQAFQPAQGRTYWCLPCLIKGKVTRVTGWVTALLNTQRMGIGHTWQCDKTIGHTRGYTASNVIRFTKATLPSHAWELHGLVIWNSARATLPHPLSLAWATMPTAIRTATH